MFVPIIVSAVVYFLCSVAIAFGIARYAKARGKKPQRWGLGVLLIAFLIPFWDLIPTIVTREYFCSTEAGLRIYKSPEKWKAENPGVYETLVREKLRRPYTNSVEHITPLNQRFNWVSKIEGPLLFNRWRVVREIRDEKSGEVIARQIDFQTGQERPQADWSGWKFWLQSSQCYDVDYGGMGNLGGIQMQLWGLKK